MADGVSSFWSEGLESAALYCLIFTTGGEFNRPAASISNVGCRRQVGQLLSGYLRECLRLAPALGGHCSRVVH